MERDVHRGTWNKKAPLGTILLLMSMLAHTLASETSGECSGEEYPNSNGTCCNKCPPGFWRAADCRGAGLRTDCKPCPKGYYMENMNYHSKCLECKKCKDHDQQFSACTPTTNTICGCKQGSYKVRIDSIQYQCEKCKQCGSGEREIEKCTPEKNTVCECKENYFRVTPTSKCEPSKNCTACVCEHSCPLPYPTTVGPDPGKENLISIIVGIGAAAVVSVVMIVFTYMATKRHVEKKLKSSFDASQDSCQHVLINKEPSNNISIKASPLSPPSDDPHLPDCVPVEIKIPELIYMVLDLVPVLQVKQLVRSLGVKDTEIEQAELDHRSCREAHYQMLRVWAERGSRAGGVLHWPLLQQLLEELRKLHLEQAAQELEINCIFQ